MNLNLAANHQPPATSHSQAEWDLFNAALQIRRHQVYDYLENWPGTEHFKPSVIHDALFSYIRRRGKALRPLLLLLCCGAVGGDETVAIPAAAAVEIFQTWTLVHDDIIDRDETRRGSPTVHAQYRDQARTQHNLATDSAAHYGTAVAILAGDLQQSWCYALLADLQSCGVSPQLVLELIRRMSSWLTPELMEGEMLDVQYSFAPLDSLDREDLLVMLGKKTAVLLEYAAWCGAKIGLGGQNDPNNYAESLGHFARLSGTAFQLRDDILGLTADEALLGKPVGSDLREGKRTLLIFEALSTANPQQRDAIVAALGNSSANDATIRQALAAIAGTGAIERVQSLANSYVSQAHEVLEGLPESQYKQLLVLWADFLSARQH